MPNVFITKHVTMKYTLPTIYDCLENILFGEYNLKLLQNNNIFIKNNENAKCR